MSRQHIPVKDITIGTKGWTMKVIVEAKGMPRSSQRSPVKYQRMILRDSAGTKVQVTIFDSDIDKFSDVLTLYKTYYISNAVVKTILPQHRISSNDYQWHINSKTVVEEVTEEYLSISVSPYNFVPFSEFSKYINSDVYVDVIGVVIDAHPTREIPTVNGPQRIQELVLVDQQLILKILTMWDQFIENECAAIVKNIKNKPIIAAYGTRIVSFNVCQQRDHQLLSLILIFQKLAYLNLGVQITKHNLNNSLLKSHMLVVHLVQLKLLHRIK
ncbi:hypothetical protein UlMin_016617 [Ulmus minor]